MTSQKPQTAWWPAAEVYRCDLAVIRQMGRKGDVIHVNVQARSRVQLLRAEAEDPYLNVDVHLLPEPSETSTEVEALYS